VGSRKYSNPVFWQHDDFMNQPCMVYW